MSMYFQNWIKIKISTELDTHLSSNFICHHKVWSIFFSAVSSLWELLMKENKGD